MATEIELKVLDIDPVVVRNKLKQLGAKPKDLLAKQRRYVFDIDPKDQTRWLRLRTNGTKTTLAVKIIQSDLIDGTLEYETEVSDIENTLSILKMLGFSPKSYQENYRENYILNDVEISIDYWPQLKPYLELESDARDSITQTLKQLELEEHQTTSANTTKLYSQNGIELSAIKKLIFTKEEELLVKGA